MRKNLRITGLTPILLFAFCSFGLAQGVAKAVPPSPSTEEFQILDKVAIPYRDALCLDDNGKLDREPVCKRAYADQYNQMKPLKIVLYDETGANWHRIELAHWLPDYFAKDLKLGFVPLSYSTTHGIEISLRAVGESKSWYKVEVDKTTRSTKYILKSDTNWTLVNWAFGLTVHRRIRLDKAVIKFHRSPNDGKPIDILENNGNDMSALLIEGEWVYGRIFDYSKPQEGWIRWKNGREILVGCIYNNFKVPTFTD